MFIDPFNTPAAYGMAVRRTGIGLGSDVDLFNTPAAYGMAVRRTLLMHHWLEFLDSIHGFCGALSKEGCRNIPIGLQWAISDYWTDPLKFQNR